MAKTERTIVELKYNCVEGKIGDVVAMQDDMVKAYGKDYVKKIKDKELEATLEEAIEYATENEVAIPKNINVGRFIKRVEDSKLALAEKAEQEKNAPVNAEDIEAFETLKEEFAQEKIDNEEAQKLVDAEILERGEAVEEKETELAERETALNEREEAITAKETELANAPKTEKGNK